MHLTKNILSVNSIEIGYTVKKQTKTIAKNINLNIRNGEVVCLLGPNGCGKSTLMRSIAGLQPIFAGDILIDKTQINKLTAIERAQKLSLVLTDKLSVSGISVLNIVAVGRYPYTNSMGKLNKTDKQKIQQALEKCGLKGFENRLYLELSDGEKQRVMIARALAQDTPLMMLDEPTAHLDLPNRIELMKIMKKLAKETHKAIIISTHELDLALQWADTIWIMDKCGQIVNGAPEDIVLNGSLTKVFGNDSFTFNMNTGTFIMHYETNNCVELIGNGIEYEWTKRALIRDGFNFSENEKTFSTIEVLNNQQWLFSCGNNHKLCSSISELLMYLHHESYFMKKHTVGFQEQEKAFI